MRYIDKNSFATPAILENYGTAKTVADKTLYLANKAKYTSSTRTIKDSADSIKISDKYKHEDVKTVLKTSHHNRCCYCEARITATQYGDVEHFRPKGGYMQDDTDYFHKPGYFWLAYDMSNLLLSCVTCNRGYKKNYFPLKDNAKRCRMDTPFSIENEEPLIIHPYNIDPSDHIGFNQNIPFGTSQEGSTTISTLGLDRQELNEDRENSLHPIQSLCEIYEMNIGTPMEATYEKIFKDALSAKIGAKGEFTLMFKKNFARYL